MSDDVKVTYPSPGKVGCVGETAGREYADGFEPPVTIGVDHIKIGDVVLPGHWIERDGVVVSPGFAELTRYAGGLRESSRVTVTFLVGDIDVEAGAIGYVALRQRMAHAIDIALAEPADAEQGIQVGVYVAPDLEPGLVAPPTDQDAVSGLD